MGKNQKKKIPSNIEIKKSVSKKYTHQKSVNNNKDYKTDKKRLNFDVSFEGLYHSVKVGSDKFNNHLTNEKDFVNKFKQVREIITKLKDKDFENEIKKVPNFHCHYFDKEKDEIAKEGIINSICHSGKSRKEAKALIEHQLNGERLYQMGINDGVRIVGTYEEGSGVFRIYMIDYHHDLYPDEKRNKVGKKTLNFCPMKKIV